MRFLAPKNKKKTKFGRPLSPCLIPCHIVSQQHHTGWSKK